MPFIPLTGASGIVGWARVDPGDIALGDWCWTLHNGYAVRTAGRRHLSMHREILGLQRGDGLIADHINGNRLDNRRSNLRTVDRRGNAQNVGSRGGTSRHRGVRWHKRAGRWLAQAKVDGVYHYLGLFDDEDEAAAAAAAFRAQHMPFSREALCSR